MTSKIQNPIPLPAIRRLPAYLRLLKAYKIEGETWVSATSLAQELRYKPIQVRKDMAWTGVEGKPKVGFNIDDLILAINYQLGWDNTTDAVLIGVGNLGRALDGYKGFGNYGLKTLSVHDTDPQKIGTKLDGLIIKPMDALEDSVKRFGIHIAILTTPTEYVQEIAERLVTAGITGIWNFAPGKLKLPADIVIQRTDLATGFAELSSKLKNQIIK